VHHFDELRWPDRSEIEENKVVGLDCKECARCHKHTAQLPPNNTTDMRDRPGMTHTNGIGDDLSLMTTANVNGGGDKPRERLKATANNPNHIPVWIQLGLSM